MQTIEKFNFVLSLVERINIRIDPRPPVQEAKKNKREFQHILNGGGNPTPQSYSTPASVNRYTSYARGGTRPASGAGIRAENEGRGLAAVNGNPRDLDDFLKMHSDEINAYA